MLTGKIALVTGAGRGIGRQIAKTLAGAGAYVYVNYCGSREQAEEAVKEIEEAGGRAQGIRCDVADFEAVERMLKQIMEEQGRLDILVNNAGITKDNLLMKMSEEEFDRVLATNLKGAFHTIRHASRHFIKQRGGKIVNISSVSGVLGNAGQANYSASKAGIIGLTKSAARELAARGINVNAVAPGYIDTEMTACLSDAVKERTLSQIPLGRTGSTTDIANAVLFLVSEQAAYITGQVLSVDGGMAI